MQFTGMYPGRVLASSDAETVILDAQNSSECVNLDTQIMILNAQNRSIGVQLDLKILFQIWRMKSKLIGPPNSKRRGPKDPHF